MSLSPAPVAFSIRRLGLRGRLWLMLGLLIAETLCLSYLIQGTPIDLVVGAARTVRDLQHWLFRFLIAYVGCMAVLVQIRGPVAGALARDESPIPWRARWLAAHVATWLPLAWLSADLYHEASVAVFLLRAAAWHLCGLAALGTLAAAVAPLPVWRGAWQRMRALVLMAALPAAAAVLAIGATQELWVPAAKLTFWLVGLLLDPWLPALSLDPATLTLGTPRFTVSISTECSGLEGVGLMLVFCGAWLWAFHREFRFPRALLVLPAAALLVFGLNVLRIAALLLIGDAGHTGVAMIGFHSQAGWIAFNLAAFSVAYFSRRIPALRSGASAAQGNASGDVDTRRHAEPQGNADPQVAAYLLPFLAILAAGMLTTALSANFNALDGLRAAAAAAALWAMRHHYPRIDWRIGGRAPLVGAAVFALWMLAARFLTVPAVMPEALQHMSALQRDGWIGARLLTAVVAVPIAEELAFRGYLLRRLRSAQFATLPYAATGNIALLASAAVFGAMHGVLWAPAMVAGIAYARLTQRSGGLTEAMLAHATTNALVAVAVLAFDQWQLW